MKLSLYLSKFQNNLNSLESIFNLLSAFFAGVFFLGGEGAICDQSEEATTVQSNICVKTSQSHVFIKEISFIQMNLKHLNTSYLDQSHGKTSLR